jgi:hypothetical protein
MSPFFDSSLGRRDLILGAAPFAAFAAAPALARAADAAQSGRWRPDFQNPTDNVQAYMKLTSSLDDGFVMGWFGGHVFSLIPDQPLTPLMRLEGFGVGKAIRERDGTYKILWKEVGYYKDLVNDQVLDTWVNPLNHQRTDVMHIHNLGVTSKIAPSFSHVSGGPPGMVTATVQNANYTRPNDPAQPFILPWFQVSDSVSLWMDVSAVLPNPLSPKIWVRESSGPTIRIAEQFLYTAKASDFFNPDLPSVDYVGGWNRFSPWLPWMLMGDAPGGLFVRAATRRLRSYDELPRPLYNYTAKHFPEFLDPAVDPNRRNESSWEVFMKERKPAPPI